ncbi:hypothetical protein VNO78_08482 [Psophocarpus tetragonolobus]|uniref:Uncharacterized protein n=1 Tax=Psophocarpus tetragonolobus TaxID=3891 RepID=A0AAN9T5B1_PSOTE
MSSGGSGLESKCLTREPSSLNALHRRTTCKLCYSLCNSSSWPCVAEIFKNVRSEALKIKDIGEKIGIIFNGSEKEVVDQLVQMEVMDTKQLKGHFGEQRKRAESVNQ